MSVQSLLQRFDKLSSRRSTWEDHWQDLGELFLPRQATFTAERTPGDKRQWRQFDGVPMQAARGLAASLDGLLKPKSERWFSIRTDNEAVNEDDEAKEWFEFAEERMWNVIYRPRARFLQRTGAVDLSLVVFGTGILFVGDRLMDGMIDLRTFPLKTCYMLEGADGQIDTLFRRFKLTARQAAQQFGEDRIGKETRDLLKSAADTECDFMHVVMPREDRRFDGAPQLAMPFASFWIDVKSKHTMREGGFQEMPYIVPRWDVTDDEVYGRSPAMVALPDASTLMQQAKTLLRAGHNAVDPPMLFPNDGMSSPLRTWPGSRTPYDPSILANTHGRSPVFPLENGAKIPLGREMQQDSRDSVQAAFFRNVLQLPTQGPQMTATEILERREEFIRVIGPTFGRLESDYTYPMVDRIFNILLRAGQFGTLDDIPDILSDREIVFELTSPLTRAMKRVETAGLRQTQEDLAGLIEFDPTILDNYDLDVIAREVPEANGVPTSWLRQKDTVTKLRKDRAQQQAEMARAAAAQQAGEALIDAGSKMPNDGVLAQ